MKKEFFAPAKLNLFLKVVGKRDDGYHLLESIMQTISLFDIITLEVIDGEDIKIFCDELGIPSDENNIAYRCANEVFEYIGERKGIRIYIKKNIPSGAGMGGGSADGAMVIRGLNEVLSLNLSLNDMINIGSRVGADIPFFILGGTAKITGIGEKVEKICSIPECFFVVVKPDISISTKDAYKKIDNERLNKSSNFDNILMSIEKRDLHEIAGFLDNDFEKVAPYKIVLLKEKLKELGAINSLMTGSGSAVFGVFKSEKEALFAKEKLESFYNKVYLVKGIDKW